MTRPSAARNCAIVLLLFTAVSVAAGQSTVSISGRVVDASGDLLPGVKITAKNGERSTDSIARADGTFVVTDLQPGAYTLSATLPGFRTERRRVQVTAGQAKVVDFNMRVGCINETVTVSSHPPLIDSRLPARSDLVAYLRIDELIDEDSPSDPDCRVRYRATVLRAVARRSSQKVAAGTVDVLLNADAAIELGREYIIWLTWRADKNAFDSGSDVEGVVRPVEQGHVKVRTGPCVEIQNPPADHCPDTYSVDALMTILEGALR